jgi:hypothetical protein
VNYDDEILMAYADGEIDEPRRAEIAAAVERDPDLARRVERHRAMRAKLAGAYSPVLDQRVPDHLLAAVTGTANAAKDRAQGRAEVLPFPARAAPASNAAWRGRQWAAVAASLVLGALISWKIFAPAESAWIGARDGALVARGPLAHALDSQLASTQRPEDAIQIGLTFRSREGGYCRSFVVRGAGTAGLACRDGTQWRVPVTAATQPHAGELRQATSLPSAISSAIETRIAGEALDATGEERARLGGWDAKRE